MQTLTTLCILSALSLFALAPAASATAILVDKLPGNEFAFEGLDQVPPLEPVDPDFMMASSFCIVLGNGEACAALCIMDWASGSINPGYANTGGELWVKVSGVGTPASPGEPYYVGAGVGGGTYKNGLC